MTNSRTITWLHLSDLCLAGSPPGSYQQDALLQELLRDLDNLARKDSLQPDFVAITGDIALHGTASEYQVAAEFFDRLLNATNLPRDRLFVVPGNHDVDRSAVKMPIRDLLKDRATVDDLLRDDLSRAAFLGRLHNYRDFVNHYFGDHMRFDEHAYFYTGTIIVAERHIAILGLNTAWTSQDANDKGQLILGERQVHSALESTKAAHLRLALLHHPLEWLRDFDQYEVAPLLLKGCDFILHGHVHQIGLQSTVSPESSAIAIGAGGIGGERSRVSNTYNMVQLDLATGRGEIILRAFSNRQHEWTSDTVTYRDAPRGSYQFVLPRRLLSKRISVRPVSVDRSIDAGELKIFLSYAREDRELVEGLYDQLAGGGLKPWMDTRDILPGEAWQSSVQTAIRSSSLFLVCLSQKAVDRRGYVQREIRHALDLWREMLESDLYVIPVKLEECPVPEPLAAFQSVDLFQEDGEERLWGAIRAVLESIGVSSEQFAKTSSALGGTGSVEEAIPHGLVLRQVLEGHSDVITRMAWSPKGDILASPSLDRTIRLWNDATGASRILRGHKRGIYSLAWSPDGHRLASGSDEGQILIWDANSERKIREINEHRGRIECLAWSPDGELLASASADHEVRIWSTTSWKLMRTLKGHRNWVNGVAWSPDGRLLVTAAEDNTVRIWDGQTGEVLHEYEHAGWVSDVAWSPNGKLIASASHDRTIHLWDVAMGRKLRILEGHTDFVRCVAFAPDSQLLLSRAADNTVRFWRCDTGQMIGLLSEVTASDFNSTPGIAFHPASYALATLGDLERTIRIWDVDVKVLLATESTPVVEYLNAKVVLLGEPQVGKSGLGFRIAENQFRRTEPTHGAHFWQIPVETVPGLANDIKAEITLWDLAGQPDYRLAHELFLDNVDAAILLFDCSDPNDPFRGVPYWAKSLKRRTQDKTCRLLVAAKCDIAPVTVGSHEIDLALSKFQLDDYVRTSAKDGEGIAEVVQKLVEGIQWSRIPRTTTPVLFQLVREFLMSQRASGTKIINIEGVLNFVQTEHNDDKVTSQDVGTVVSLLESQGLVFRLDPTPSEAWVLLQPELLNKYASSIIKAARNHPHGIGAVPEREVIERLPFQDLEERLSWHDEFTVIETVVSILIKQNICFRELGMLVFPSLINISRPPLPADHPRTDISYRFAGDLETMYASLVVRLSYSQYFQRRGQWKHAVEFTRNGSALGFMMQEVRNEEGTGQLDIYFEPDVPNSDRILFSQFITDHLRVKGVQMEEHFRLYCPNCKREIWDVEAINARVTAKKLDIVCVMCDTRVMIPQSIEDLYRQDSSLMEKKQGLSEVVMQRTSLDAAEIIIDQRQYGKEDTDMLHILHISDIHLGTQEQARKYLLQLETDLRRELEVDRLEYLVLSGDAADRSTPDEYQAAFELIDGVLSRFGLDPSRVVIVPGNHDLNWDLSEQGYDFVPSSKLPKVLPEGRVILAENVGALIRNDDRYRRRFANFGEHLYGRIYGAPYPLDYVEQGAVLFRPDDQLVFLALNSCWEIDHHHKTRSSINMDALSKAVERLHDHQYDHWLKIAVWHYPVTGKEMMNDEFLQLLSVHGFQVCMHGHIHRVRKAFYNYDDARGIHIIGAGTFGAPAKDQVPGIPLQYNLLALDRETRTITVHTRKKDDPDGAWDPDHRWGSKKDLKPCYEIKLHDWTFGPNTHT